MCGIAGFVGNYRLDELVEMNQSLRHRGPDGSGNWFNSELGVGFTHRRLAIIDLTERGAQPMIDSTNNLVIVFNGEIYNYKELQDELLAEGYCFQSDCDTEVILNLFLRDGVKCLDHLIGMYAFALWDFRARELLLARDPSGVKPLYYHESPRGFLFASELKAIICISNTDLKLDPVAVSQYLGFLYTPGGRTMLASVRKLLPGHAMIVRESGRKYEWSFRGCNYLQPISDLSEDEAVSQTRFYLREAVKKQLVADVPVGAFLSGGLDSSSIVAFGKSEIRNGKMQCFTIASSDGLSRKEGWASDFPYADRVAKYLDVDLHTIHVEPKMGEKFAWMVAQLDEPQADPAALNAYFVSHLARSRGIKVLLSGAGGDDIFSGYRRHYAVMLERFWAWMPTSIRKLLASSSAPLSLRTPFGRRFSKWLQFADWNSTERLIAYFLWLHPALLHSLLSPEFRKGNGIKDFMEPMFMALEELPAKANRLNKMLHLEERFFLADHNLNYTDKMSMAAGVEVRVPFLDPELKSFAARLPIKFKQRGDVGKWILKRAMEPFLPHDIIYRPKTGFGVPLRQWMRGELRTQMADLISETTLKTRGIFDPAGVARLLELDREGRVDGSYTIFAIMCIEMWCQEFLGNKRCTI